MDIALIISAGILIGCILGLSWFAGSDAPFVPTKMDNIRKILKLAGVKRGKKFYELGSGDGRVVFEAAKLGASSFGIEQSWIRVLYSRWKAKQLKLTVCFVHGDIFNKSFWRPVLSLRGAQATKQSSTENSRHSILDADIVYIFLLPKSVQKLESKLQRELKKGSVVIIQTYHFKSWKPFKKEGDFCLYRA